MKIGLFALVLAVVAGLILALPVITIDTAAIISSSAYSYIRAACYFIPVGTVTIILGLILSFWLFRMLVSLIKAIWDILPVA